MAEKVVGKVAVVCNACEKELSIPTGEFYQPGGVKHNNFGSLCRGTFRTVNQRKPQSHKKSRDKAIKNKQKG